VANVVAVPETECRGWLARNVVTWLVLKNESLPEEGLEDLVPERTDTERRCEVGAGEVKTGQANDSREHECIGRLSVSRHCAKNESRLDGD
jgi:hypothetical protein